MRTINEIIVHCSDTPEGRNDKAEDIRRWHVNGNGWSDIGYHYVVDLDGTIELGRDVALVGAHATGHNANSLGVCYIGGRDAQTGCGKDTRTDAQKVSLRVLLQHLRARFPDARIIGHCNVSNKRCPCFDAKNEYKDL